MYFFMSAFCEKQIVYLQVKVIEKPPSPVEEGLDEIDDFEAELQRRMEERRLQWQRDWAKDQVCYKIVKDISGINCTALPIAPGL